MEHLFLLVNEFLHVEVAGLFRELNPRPHDVKGLVDLVSLGAGDHDTATRLCCGGFSSSTISLSEVVSWGDIRILDATERRSGCSRVFLPDFLTSEKFLGFFLLSFLGFTGHEDFLIVGWLEGRSLVLVLCDRVNN